MTLTDVLSKEEWTQFEKELYERWQISATVYDTSGVSITEKPNWCNRLCPQIKANKDSLATICAPGNQNFMAMAKQTKKPVIGECDAGLIKIAVPIHINGEFIGTAGGCGLLPEDGEVESFLIEKSAGLDEEKITELCDGLGSMTESQAKEMADFIENRIDQYVGLAQSRGSKM
jgi:ligand-binding sensor protein